MRSSVAETVPTQHVREVDYQLTRVLRTISGNNTSSFDSGACIVLLLSPRFDAERHFEGIRSQRPQRDLYARCQIRTYPSPSVRWQTQVLVEPTSTIGFTVGAI